MSTFPDSILKHNLVPFNECGLFEQTRMRPVWLHHVPSRCLWGVKTRVKPVMHMLQEIVLKTVDKMATAGRAGGDDSSAMVPCAQKIYETHPLVEWVRLLSSFDAHDLSSFQHFPSFLLPLSWLLVASVVEVLSLYVILPILITSWWLYLRLNYLIRRKECMGRTYPFLVSNTFHPILPLVSV